MIAIFETGWDEQHDVRIRLPIHTTRIGKEDSCGHRECHRTHNGTPSGEEQNKHTQHLSAKPELKLFVTRRSGSGVLMRLVLVGFFFTRLQSLPRADATRPPAGHGTRCPAVIVAAHSRCLRRRGGSCRRRRHRSSRHRRTFFFTLRRQCVQVYGDLIGAASTVHICRTISPYSWAGCAGLWMLSAGVVVGLTRVRPSTENLGVIGVTSKIPPQRVPMHGSMEEIPDAAYRVALSASDISFLNSRRLAKSFVFFRGTYPITQSSRYTTGSEYPAPIPQYA